MAVMEDLIATLGKLPDGTPDDVKKSIKELFQGLSVESGKAKTDLETYKKGDSEYKKLTKKLKDAGIEENQFDSIADELGVKKTLQDELAITSTLYKEALKGKQEADKAVKLLKMEGVLGKKVEALAQAYKTEDGKTVKISEKFIDKKELYKELDLESDVLVQDRVQRVIKAAFENQSAFMKEAGLEFQGQPVHKVGVGDSQFGSGKALDEAAIVASYQKTNGDPEAAIAALTAYERAGAIYGKKDA